MNVFMLFVKSVRKCNRWAEDQGPSVAYALKLTFVELNDLTKVAFVKQLPAERQQAECGSARFLKIAHHNIREDLVVYGSKIAKDDRPLDGHEVGDIHFESGQNVLLIHSPRRRSDPELEPWREVRNHSSISRRNHVVRLVYDDVVKVVRRPLTESPIHGLNRG